jgi:hypothetical protein
MPVKRPIDCVLEVMELQELADAAGVDKTTVYYWLGDKRGLQNGYIPSHYIPAIYRHIQKMGIALSLERIMGIPPRQRSGNRKGQNK